MKEELAQKANEALLEIINGAIATKEFVIEQAPDVIAQLLAWNAVKSAIGFGVSAGILIGAIANLILAGREAKKRDLWMYDDELFIRSFIGTLLLVVAAIVMPILMCENMDWLQILIAPKLYLVEYAANLIK